LNNDYGRDVLLQAINGNATAISQLATTLNCDINAVQAALNSLTQIQSVGNQVGLTGQQIINSIQSGNCQITSQLASCCCDVKNLVTTQGYENRIANAENTAAIINKIDAQTNMINDKFCALEMREMQNKIDALRDEKLALQTNISQRAQNEYIATSLYPISTALTELRADFDCFKSHLPETISVQKNSGVYVPYSPYSVVPNCAFNYNGWNNWNGNCNGSLWG
jgi:chromosome condensin MukBEF ATPase and DNA-binding subunit MukB